MYGGSSYKCMYLISKYLFNAAIKKIMIKQWMLNNYNQIQINCQEIIPNFPSDKREFDYKSNVW